MTRWALALSLATLTGCAAPAASYAPPQLGPVPAGPAPMAMGPQAAPNAAPPQMALGVAPQGPAAVPPQGDTSDGEIAALDDDDEEDGAAAASPTSSPLLQLSDGEIDYKFHHDLASLGSVSVGRPGAGVLVNGVQMPQSERWHLQDPAHAWGTQETVDSLTRIIGRVNERFPADTFPLNIGHISAKNGGHLSPHVSHQAGRDADVGFYYRGGPRAFVRGTDDNLDLPRTWALVKAAIKETPIEMIFVDHSIQRMLATYAAASGEDPAFIDEIFQIRGKNPRAVIRHVKGHNNHLHFRWHSPVAEAMGQRVARFVVVPKAPPHSAPAGVASSQAETAGFATIKAHSGDTLVILARRYGTTVEEIQRLNGLGGNAIRAGVVYKIPQKVPPKPVVKAAPVHKPVGKVAQKKPASTPHQGAKQATSAPDR